MADTVGSTPHLDFFSLGRDFVAVAWKNTLLGAGWMILPQNWANPLHPLQFILGMAFAMQKWRSTLFSQTATNTCDVFFACILWSEWLRTVPLKHCWSEASPSLQKLILLVLTAHVSLSECDPLHLLDLVHEGLVSCPAMEMVLALSSLQGSPSWPALAAAILWSSLNIICNGTHCNLGTNRTFFYP